jgi:hypothetical protein
MGLRKLLSGGELRYFQPKPHGRIKFKAEWLEAYISQHTKGGGAIQPKKIPPRKRQGAEGEKNNSHGITWELLR